MQQLTQISKTVVVSVPKDYSDAAATTEWINMKLADKIRFVIVTGAWAGGTSAVTVLQATSDGGSSKAVSFAEYYTGTGDTQTRTTATSNTFTLAAASTKYIIEIPVADMDVSGGYDWIAIAAATPGTNADLYCIIAEVYQLGFETLSAPTTI